jgi:TusE/DsrC/DsvC family sulfur relay protein
MTRARQHNARRDVEIPFNPPFDGVDWNKDGTGAGPSRYGAGEREMRDAHDILKEILDPTGQDTRDEGFPYAPWGWQRESAAQQAADEGIEMTEDHWEAVRVLQGCFGDEEEPPVRRIADALEARFADKGGRQYLFTLFPGGPIAQGCRIAGLAAPSGSVDQSFGSVR